MEKTEWRPIPGWGDLYEVSNDGRARSLDRVIFVPNPHGVVAPRRYRGRELNLFITGKGYPSMKLSRPGQRSVTVYLHEAVMTAFVGPRPADLEVCHNNGNPGDGRLFNLRYDTRSANAQDAIRHRKERS